MSFDSVIDIVSLTNVILVMRFTINYVDIKRHLSGRRDLNPLPTAWEAVALPGELLPLIRGSYRPASGGTTSTCVSNLRNCLLKRNPF